MDLHTRYSPNIVLAGLFVGSSKWSVFDVGCAALHHRADGLQLIRAARMRKGEQDDVLSAELQSAAKSSEAIHLKCYVLCDWRYVTVCPRHARMPVMCD